MEPVIAISMGDPAGISPEILAHSLDLARRVSRPIVFGHWPTFEHAVSGLEIAGAVEVRASAAEPSPNRVLFVHCGDGDSPIDRPGSLAGQAQLAALGAATSAVLSGLCAGLVTAPVSKKLIAAPEPEFTGHTEYLARRSSLDSDAVTMAFVSDALVVGLVTTHLPLRAVPDALTHERLFRTASHLERLLAQIRPAGRFRFGVAGLNPHAGEEGLLGDEERELIAPFCRSWNERQGAELVGPLSADAVFREALASRFDGVIALYHDQAMIPLKLSGPGSAVNLTLGLPFPRTSPDHGVAYDLARKGQADNSGMKAAIAWAARLAKRAAPNPGDEVSGFSYSAKLAVTRSGGESGR